MKKSPEDLRKKAIHDITNLLESLAASTDEKQQKRSNLLSYWISDYCRMLKSEDTFLPQKLIRYKRGQIVKVHLGYRIGSEEGGLHYAIVLDNKNNLSSSVLTIIPLTSVKKHVNPNKLPRGNVFLGNEIYRTLFAKVNSLLQQATAEYVACENSLSELEAYAASQVNPSQEDRDNIKARIAEIRAQVDHTHTQIKYWDRTKKELDRMKTGSIALVGQITTVSKQRIYDPLRPHDPLKDIRVSNDILDRIDKKIIELFTNPNTHV